MTKNRIILSVIGAILLASMLACKAGALLATSTPVPTNTPVPTVTPLPTETAEPTEISGTTEQTDSNDADPEKGETALEELADGAQKFTDKTGGYTITFPDKWVIVDASEGNLSAMMDLAAENNPDLKDILSASSSMMVEGARFFAIYYHPDFISGSSAPVAYTMLDKTTASFPLDTLIELNAQMLPQMLEQAEILDSGMGENVNGVEYGYIELLLNVNDTNGDPIQIYERMLFFQTDENTIMTVLGVKSDLQEALDEIFDGIVDSVEMSD